MSNTCHPFWKWYKTLTFCSFLTRSTIPCACHANRHLNLQKRRIHVVFCTCWLRNVLRATTACNFSSLICSEPTFRPSRAINHVKNTVFHNFHTFCRICISFFLLTLPLLWSSLFYSSLLSDSSYHCFSSVHIVGSLTFKLPLIYLFCYIYL